MTNETKKKIGTTAWRSIFAMVTESKDGVQAVSLTRMLALACFGYLSYGWLSQTPVADSLLHTFYGLMGVKTAEVVVALTKGFRK